MGCEGVKQTELQLFPTSKRKVRDACNVLILILHQFYGESTPFGKKSHKTAEILGYLNSQQALADYAIMIRSLKQNLSSEASPVVVFGGSYGGTWFRLKYPHIAIGALASSAPILQFDNIVPLTSFYDAISQDFKDASVKCFKVIKRSWEELDAVSNMKHGLPELKMVMTLSCSNKSMFPPYENDFEKIEEQFMSRFGVKPRPHWITTEFGGKGAHHAYGSQGSYERRPGVVKRAEEARGGHYRKVDQ
ncbi:lysosomal Pro-X carboxypeptidase-like [Brassica napus]|uniref:lysosomal Pro-X carboxypeptidase-like n=1 Tax=Brassica napus TaxID=3708 RepID=UPI0020786852|nr:lysosomal Pro-X carboxypeptidase-like [Brassica napus]